MRDNNAHLEGDAVLLLARHVPPSHRGPLGLVLVGDVELWMIFLVDVDSKKEVHKDLSIFPFSRLFCIL